MKTFNFIIEKTICPLIDGKQDVANYELEHVYFTGTFEDGENWFEKNNKLNDNIRCITFGLTRECETANTKFPYLVEIYNNIEIID